jgi:Holliday junction resolvase RusA-like endonuclease
MQFEVKGKICGKGRPRFARRGNYVSTYTDKITASYENLIKLSFINAGGEIINKPNGVSISITAAFLPPASLSEKKKRSCLSGETAHIKTPDIDNVLKVVMDALNKVAYEDDSQVCSVDLTKVYWQRETLIVVIDRN